MPLHASPPDRVSRLLIRGLISGSVGALTSTAALLLRSRHDARTALSAQNAVSHWVWGEEAMRQHSLSARHTLVGYGIHHASSVFWGVLYERSIEGAPPESLSRELLRASAFSVLANVVDFHLTPRRFKPGFERHLTKKSLLAVYAAFAVGLAAGHLLQGPPPAGSPSKARTDALKREGDG